MTPRTAQALAAINQRFYAEDGAEAFHRTRSAPWPGFERIAEAVQGRPGTAQTLRLLDVGCGNGRLGRYLRDSLDATMDYTGVDASPALLAHARAALGAGADLRTHDLVGCSPSALPAGPFDCVAAVAVLHHIPGAEMRRALVRALSDRLAPGGLLVLTAWRFDRLPRVQRHLLPWHEYNQGAGAPIDMDDLEAGDHLVRWGDDPAQLRYCHLVDDDELSAAADAAGLRTVLRYDADGRSNHLNGYLLLERRP